MAAVSLLRCSNMASVSLLSSTNLAAVSLPRCSTAPIWPPFHCLGAPILTYELTLAHDKFY